MVSWFEHLLTAVKLVLLRAELVVMEARRLHAYHQRLALDHVRVVQLVLVTVIINDRVDVVTRSYNLPLS